FSSWFLRIVLITRMWSSLTPGPVHICSILPRAADGCPPLIQVVAVSWMITAMLDLLFTVSSNPVMPEWAEVLSPMTAMAGTRPASAAHFGMVMEAPIYTHELIDS